MQGWIVYDVTVSMIVEDFALNKYQCIKKSPHSRYKGMLSHKY